MAQAHPHSISSIDLGSTAESQADDTLADLDMLNRSSIYAAWLESEVDGEEVMDSVIDELLH